MLIDTMYILIIFIRVVDLSRYIDEATRRTHTLCSVQYLTYVHHLPR